MTKWIDGDNTYKATYLKSIFQSNSLRPEVLKRLSLPEAWSKPSDYVNTAPRILVLGQETYGNYTPLAGADAAAAFDAQMAECKSFDYAINDTKLNNRSKFWRAFDEIKEAFGFASRRSIGWSNLIKSQVIDSKTSSNSITRNMSSADIMEVIRWQRDLFRAEFAYFRPQAVLMLNGGVTWVLGHMFEDVQFSPEGSFNIVTSSEINVPVAQTYHPSARLKGDGDKVVSARYAALQYLMAALASGRAH